MAALPLERIDAASHNVLLRMHEALGNVTEDLDPARGQVDAAYDAVRSGEVERPDVYPHDVSRTAVAERVAASAAGLAELSAMPPSPLRAAYIERGAEMLATARLLQAVLQQNVSDYQHYSGVLYGTPDAGLAMRVARHFAAVADRSAEVYEHRPEVVKAARAVLHGLSVPRSNVAPGDLRPVGPSQIEYDRAKAHHTAYIERIIGGLAIPIKVTYEDRKVLFPQIRQRLGIPDGMYRHVPQDPARKTWGIEHLGNGKIKDPGTPMAADRFVGLVVLHEIATHVGERINAMSGSVGLLELGMAGYGLSSEGKGVMREAIAFDTLDEYLAHKRHQTIMMRTLMAELPHVRPTSFVDMWRINQNIKALHILLGESGKDLSFAEAQNRAERPAFDEVRRGNRGGMHRPDGSMVPHRKDYVYLPGLLTETALAATMPAYSRIADVGKYSLGNPTHTRPLVRVGILTAQDLKRNDP